MSIRNKVLGEEKTDFLNLLLIIRSVADYLVRIYTLKIKGEITMNTDEYLTAIKARKSYEKISLASGFPDMIYKNNR